MRLSTLALSGLLLLGAGCQKADETPAPSGTPGSGTGLAAETRRPGYYRSVVLQTPSQVVIRRDESCSIQISGPTATVAALRTDVQDERLLVHFADGFAPPAGSDGLQLEVRTPFLSAISLAGSGNVIVQAGFEDSLSGFVTGSGSLQVLGGPFPFLSFSVIGDGKVDAHQAESQSANVHLNGGGSIQVKTKEKLVAQIDGKGTVKYYGSPAVTVNGSGASGLIQAGGQYLQGRAERMP